MTRTASRRRERIRIVQPEGNMLELTRIMIAGHVARMRREERGATAVEYGLLVALIAAVIIGVVTTLGLKLPIGFQTVINNLP
jgi:pilus assembly protein Flp/PilA